MKASFLLLPLTCMAVLGGRALAQGTSSDYALQCNGTTDYLATTALLSITNDFTIEAWINPSEPHQIDPESTSGYAGMEGEHYVIYPSHGLHCWNNGHAGVGISAGTNGVSVYEHSQYYIPATLVYQGEIKGWTHIAVVYHDRTPSLYINGTLVRTGLKSPQGFVHPCAGENAKPMRNLGGIGGGYYGHFKGAIDNFRIWDEPLSEKEIRAGMFKNYTAAPHLALNYDMNRTGQGNGLTVQDRTGLQTQSATTFGTESTPIFAPRESTPLMPLPTASAEGGEVAKADKPVYVDGAMMNRMISIRQDQVGTSEAAAEKKDAGETAVSGGAALEAIAPNPFSEGTTITYSVPAAGAVTIAIFDAGGREIARPVDGEQSAGRHEVRLDGSKLGASGTYICRMSWNGTVLTKMMTVTR
jgi:hypothetical protein